MIGANQRIYARGLLVSEEPPGPRSWRGEKIIPIFRSDPN
jgi:hypothetical protein